MLTIFEQDAGNVVGVRATGKLTHADYQHLVPQLEELIRQHGKIRMLLELEDCRGWGLGAAWDDLKFWLRHGAEVERVAVVGRKKWQEWTTKLTRPFFKGKYFDRTERDRAWQWVR